MAKLEPMRTAHLSHKTCNFLLPTSLLGTIFIHLLSQFKHALHHLYFENTLSSSPIC